LRKEVLFTLQGAVSDDTLTDARGQAFAAALAGGRLLPQGPVDL